MKEYVTLCEMSDYKALTKASLKHHIYSIHESERYSCDHCNYRETLKESLKLHVESNHEGMSLVVLTHVASNFTKEVISLT